MIMERTGNRLLHKIWQILSEFEKSMGEEKHISGRELKSFVEAVNQSDWAAVLRLYRNLRAG